MSERVCQVGCCAAVCLCVVIMFGCDAPPESSDQLRNAVHLLVDGRPEDALVLCDRILAKNLEHFEAALLRGEVYEALGNERKAIESYMLALRIQPGSAQAASSLAKFHALPVIENTDIDQTLTSNSVLGPLLIVESTSGVIDQLNGGQPTEEEPSPWHQLADRPSQEPPPDVGFPQESATNGRQTSSDLNQLRNRSSPPPILSGLQRAIEEGRRLDQLSKERESERSQAASMAADSVRPGSVVRFNVGIDVVNRNNERSGTRTTGKPVGAIPSAVFSPHIQLPTLQRSQGSRTLSVIGAARRC